MKKNIAGQKIGAQLVSATDGSSFTGGVTVSVTGDAGTQATGSVGSGACTHEGNGYHTYAPAQAETNYDLVAFTFTGTGAVPVTIQVYTRPTTGLLAPTVADRTLDVSSTGEAGIDLANVGSPTTTLNLSGTTIKTATDVESDTADIQSRIPAALVSGRIDANVGAMAANTLTASALATDAVTEIQSGLATQTSVDDLPTNAELATALASADDATLSAIAAEAIKTAAIKAKTDNLPSDPADASDIASSFSTVNGTLATLATAANLATVAGYLDTEIASILAIANKLDSAMVLDGSVYQFTANALELGPSGSGGTSDWTADQRTAIATILGIPASGTTPEVPSAGALKVIDDFLDTEVAAIKAKTDNLPADPADASDIASAFSAVNSALTTIDDFLDTEVAAIKAVTDKLNTAMVLDGAVYQFTVNALENAGGGSGSTVINNNFESATVFDVPPVAASGRLRQIVIGDDYLAANGRSFAWTVPAIAGFTASSVEVRFGASAALSSGVYSFLETRASGGVTDNGDGTWDVSIDLPGSTTENLSSGAYDWSMTLSSAGVDITKVQNASSVDRVKIVASQS